MPPAVDHCRYAGRRLQRANQYTRSVSGFAAHEIQAPMNAIGQVDICPAGRPEHDVIARRGPRIAVRRRVLPVVSLGLDDDSAHSIDQQRHPDEPFGNLRRISHEVDDL